MKNCDDASRMVEKPWGSEEIIELNERYMLKRLTMLKGHRCSLQYHDVKRETIYVLTGKLRILTGTAEDALREDVFGAEESVTIAPRTIHRMEALESCVYLEASTPETTDVVRLQDDYQRRAL